MLNLQQIESDLIVAIKAKEQIAVDTLRGLKTRIQNQKISLMKDLGEEELLALVRSEVKRRKEAAQTYVQGGRAELADKELQEAGILEKYLPAQMPAGELLTVVEKVISENSFTAKDFGVAMAKLKGQLGGQSDGASLAKLLKEKLK